MSVGDSYANAVLDAMLGSGHTSDFPATVYLAVYREDDPPSVAGGGTELGLGRVAQANDDTHWPDASGHQKENGTRITFPDATSDQPSAGYWAVHGHPTDDDVIVCGRMGDVLTVYDGEALAFEPGSIVIPCR